jgi:hypothetical protein
MLFGALKGRNLNSLAFQRQDPRPFMSLMSLLSLLSL